MTLKQALGSLLLAALLFSARPAGAIVHGKAVTGDESFAHAVVGIRLMDDDGVAGDCTGTMLTHRIVLTAAHCVRDSKSVEVVFDFSMKGTHKLAVSRIVVHPDYAPKKDTLSPGDLAILFLPPHDYQTTAIPLDGDLSFTVGEQFTIVGFGRSDPIKWNSMGTMRKAGIVASGFETPQDVGLVPTGDAWPCKGDSGGPIMRKDMSGRYALTGVLSGG
ncbi:MAG TPA: trypsin-like serine protease, partial [Dongiaceae bacterium]